MTHYRILTLALIALCSFALSTMACGDLEEGGSCDPTSDTGCICSNDDGAVVEDCDADDADDTCTCSIVTTGASNGVTGNTITISGSTFSPQTLTVTAGTAVTWNNQDAVQRAIVCSANGTDDLDQVLEANSTITHTFGTIGVYACRDRINSGPGLMGTVTVQ